MPRKNILVIKHGALGDIIQALDACASIRAGHWGEHCAVLTSPPFATLLASTPHFDAVLVDKRGGVFDLAAHFNVWRILRRDWDRVYDLQNSGRSRRYLKYLNRRGVQIFTYPSPDDGSLPIKGAMNTRDIAIRTAQMGGCGAVIDDMAWLGEPTLKQDKKSAVLPQARPTAALIPGCSPQNPDKRWPHFAPLAHALHDKGYEITLTGTAVDRGAGDAILAEFPNATDLIGKTTLAELADIFRATQLVVSNDTGPAFIAAKLGRPTLVLMGGRTDPERSLPNGVQVAYLRQANIADISCDAVLDALARLKR